MLKSQEYVCTTEDHNNFVIIFSQGQLIENQGHPGYSKHSVLTEDGYLVNLFHIKGHEDGPPFLLLHALMGASDQWFLRDEHHDLRKQNKFTPTLLKFVKQSQISSQIMLQLQFQRKMVTMFGQAILEGTCIPINILDSTCLTQSIGNLGKSKVFYGKIIVLSTNTNLVTVQYYKRIMYNSRIFVYLKTNR